MLKVYKPNRTHRSKELVISLVVPKSRIVTYGDRSFVAIAPKLWNSLPVSVRDSKTLRFLRGLWIHFSFRTLWTNVVDGLYRATKTSPYRTYTKGNSSFFLLVPLCWVVIWCQQIVTAQSPCPLHSFLGADIGRNYIFWTFNTIL